MAETGSKPGAGSIILLMSSTIRVVIAEDEPAYRNAIQRTLTLMPECQLVAACEDGQEALESCRTRLPDGVLLDWNMPVMDGLSFLRAARAEFGAEHPRIVLCTTESELARIVEALEAGAQEYVMKPFDAIEILPAALLRRLRGEWTEDIENGHLVLGPCA